MPAKSTKKVAKSEDTEQTMRQNKKRDEETGAGEDEDVDMEDKTESPAAKKRGSKKSSPNAALKKKEQEGKSTSRKGSRTTSNEETEGGEKGEEGEEKKGEDEDEEKKKAKNRKIGSMLPKTVVRQMFKEEFDKINEEKPASEQINVMIQDSFVDNLRRILMSNKLKRIKMGVIAMTHCKRKTLFGSDILLNELMRESRPASENMEYKIPSAKITKDRQLRSWKREDPVAYAEYIAKREMERKRRANRVKKEKTLAPRMVEKLEPSKHRKSIGMKVV